MVISFVCEGASLINEGTWVKRSRILILFFPPSADFQGRIFLLIFVGYEVYTIDSIRTRRRSCWESDKRSYFLSH